MTGNLPQHKPTHARILAADDDAIMREMMLARLGSDVDVVVAENGKVAWEKLSDEQFDLAIIDLAMPELDGFGLIQHLRQTPRTLDLPIIVATSRGDKEAIEQAFHAGANGFVTKPINWSLFKYTVQFTLKNSRNEKELRAHKTATELACHLKENLLELIPPLLAKQQAGVANLQESIMLDDAVELASILSPNTGMNPTQVPVNELIDGIIQDCTTQAAKKLVKLVGRKPLAEISVQVDRKIWQGALSRLVKRAIRISPPGGTVEILLGGQKDQSLVFTIRDNGQIPNPGEVEAQLVMLSTQKIDPQVPGVSLALDLEIIKQTAEKYSGKLIIQNSPGQGNVTGLWLPASRVQMARLERSA